MNKLIVLDPGHGERSNISPTVPTYIEGVEMWQYSQHLKRELEYYGFEVLTTREEVADDPCLADRGTFAGINEADLFLSLHSNATDNKGVRGTEIFYPIGNEEMKVFSQHLGEKISQLMGHGYRGSKTRAYLEGSKLNYYAVMRYAVANGCKNTLIIEHGFHTNGEDAKWMMEEKNKKLLARETAQLVAKQFEMKRKVKDNPQTGGVV